ncbi:MAG TPA: hypothetical protein VEU77_12655 [Candidatus Acidoferrales bacterium]|nr:hypothetical protein [Candidatus Acidoferrales bacterium]
MKVAGRGQLRRRLAGGGAALVLALGAIASLASQPAAPERTTADALAPSSWAMTIPTTWLAAPLPRARPGDSFDIVAIRSGDRAFAAPVAYALVVLEIDDRRLVVQVDEDDALAVANARSAGLQLVALLRSTR